MITSIVKNPLYIGHMAQCKRRVESYRTKKTVWMDKDEWIVVENTHEAIVPLETWDKCQEIMSHRTMHIKKKEEQPVFSGIFFCAECGRRMQYHIRNGNKLDYYRCGKYGEHGFDACSSHYIHYDVLYQIILDDIKRNISLVQKDEEKALKKIIRAKCSNEEKELSQATKELEKAKKRQTELDFKVKRVYEDNISGKLPDHIFTMFVSDYDTEKRELAKTIEDCETAIRNLNSAKFDASQFISLLKKYASLEKLDKVILTDLVESITISEPHVKDINRPKTITVKYKFAGQI